MNDQPNILQPISTAPRDGTYILLFGPSGYMGTPLRAEVGRWRKFEDGPNRLGELGRWGTHAADDFRDGGDAPEWWMPRPQTPTTEDLSPSPRLSAKSVIQEWVSLLPMMQQTVLLTAVRGPDGLPKYGSVKMLLRWYRRCILLSAMDGRVLEDPCEFNGGSFTGPSIGVPIADWEVGMNTHVDAYLRELDAIPRHFQMHLMHSVEILGYKHPVERVKQWWNGVYLRLVNDMHLHPESETEMNERLGDSRAGWLKRSDPATTE